VGVGGGGGGVVGCLGRGGGVRAGSCGASSAESLGIEKSERTHRAGEGTSNPRTRKHRGGDHKN